MPSYAEIVQGTLERLEDNELRKRIASGTLTDEGKSIAMSILTTRGAALDPTDAIPADSSDHVETKRQATDLSRPSAFLGLGVITTAIGFSFLLNAGQSIGFGVGVTAGRLLGASVVALPFFLGWRFFTSSGRVKSLAAAFNVFAFLLVFVWAVWTILIAAMPALLQGLLPVR